MGIILKQDENRSELQKRVAQQLHDKAKKKPPVGGDMPDGVDDSEYMKNTTQTSSKAWIWIILALAGFAGAVWYFITVPK